MTERHINAIMLYVSVFCNLILCVVLWATLRVSPSDVLARVNDLRSDFEVRNSQIMDNFQKIADELDTRADRFDAIDSELARRTKDQLFRRDFKQWESEVLTRYPEIELPELPSDDE